MKFIITEKRKFEVEATSLEEAILQQKKRMGDVSPSFTFTIEEKKEVSNYAELISLMPQIKETTCNKIKSCLDKIKELTPRIKDLCDLLYKAKENGLLTNKYDKNPKPLSFGVRGGDSLIFNTGQSYPRDTFFFIDYKGDIYSSDYSRSYDGKHTVYCESFKVLVGSPSNEEWNLIKLKNLENILGNFDHFEKEVCEDIKEQIKNKLNN